MNRRNLDDPYARSPRLPDRERATCPYACLMVQAILHVGETLRGTRLAPRPDLCRRSETIDPGRAEGQEKSGPGAAKPYYSVSLCALTLAASADRSRVTAGVAPQQIENEVLKVIVLRALTVLACASALLPCDVGAQVAASRPVPPRIAHSGIY